MDIYMKITLKEVPYNWEDEDALNYCDVGADRNFEIVANDIYTVGHIYISEDTETANGVDTPVYVDWLEILGIFQNRHLLRPILNAVYEMFGEFHFECGDEKLIPKYKHIGAIHLGLDDITENEIFKFSKEAS